MIEGINVEHLAREIAMRMAPDALLDAEDVAALLKCSARYVLEDYSKAPGFPKAIRLMGPNQRRGNARWRRSDIVEWVNSHEEQVPVPSTRKIGRPRIIPTF